MAIALIVAAPAIAIILLAANVPVAIAQQQSTGQPSAIERGTATATTRTTKDNFKVQVPQGWVMHEFRNTGSALVVEVLEGFGILAQLCPEQQPQPQQRQHQVALPNAVAAIHPIVIDNNSTYVHTTGIHVKALRSDTRCTIS